MLANAFASNHTWSWSDIAALRMEMREIKKQQSYSWINLDGVFMSSLFVACYLLHPQIEDIYNTYIGNLGETSKSTKLVCQHQ